MKWSTRYETYILFDFEENAIITLAQLESEWHENYKQGYIEPCTFAEYCNNCMYWSNGSVIPFATMEALQAYVNQ